MRKVKPGDGRALRPYRVWQAFSRSTFFLELDAGNGEVREYAVDVHYFDLSWKAVLYLGGRQEAKATLPAVFAVPGGVIETNASSFGLKRMHVVFDDGHEQPLRPHRNSAEGWRARFDRRFPRASRVLGGAAIVVLLVSLALGLPQFVEWVSHLQVVAENVGTFTSPISLPGWSNSALLTAGILAGMERALTLRNHWLIDAETWWMG